MTTFNDRLNDYINGHPKETLILIIITLSLIWQTVVAILAVVIFVLYCKYVNSYRWLLLLSGLAVLFVVLQIEKVSIVVFLDYGFYLNCMIWKLLFKGQTLNAISVLSTDGIVYLIGAPIVVSGVLSLVDLIPSNPHEKTMQGLQKGRYPDTQMPIRESIILKALRQLKYQKHNGTLLGVSLYSAIPIVIPDKFINQVALVLGTTGAGKTITLRRFYERAITQGYPLIIVDGKPDDANIAWLKDLACKNNREFYGFNCDNFRHYDPLANGGYTELKDKIVCLKDEWSSDYYRSIAEAYLQTTFEVLLRNNKNLDLNQVIDCLNYNNLVAKAKISEDEELMKRVDQLKNYEMKDITGLQAHLNILVNSELGYFFKKDESTFSLVDVINNNGVAYFALPALRFPSFSKVLGKLVINDIKAVIERNKTNANPIFTVFDEFSVFAGEQVLNLVNMGRGKGVHAIFGTQGLADLDRVDECFKSQVLNCVNTVLCHRLNDQESAETIANWIGTRDAFVVTAQLNVIQGTTGMGTVKRNKEFIVHPDSIKQELKVGEAYFVSKVDGFGWEKVRVLG